MTGFLYTTFNVILKTYHLLLGLRLRGDDNLYIHKTTLSSQNKSVHPPKPCPAKMTISTHKIISFSHNKFFHTLQSHVIPVHAGIQRIVQNKKTHHIHSKHHKINTQLLTFDLILKIYCSPLDLRPPQVDKPARG